MKGYVPWHPVYDWKDLRLRRGSNSEPLDQQAKCVQTIFFDTSGYKRVLSIGPYTGFQDVEGWL